MGSTVPLNKVHRDSLLREAGIRDWYAQAGYRMEPDEYSVGPERKGFHVDPETGVKRVSRVRSLDYEYEGDEPYTLLSVLSEESEADDSLAGYSEGAESEESVLARVSGIAELTRGEQAVTRWVLDGNGLQGAYRERMSAALGISETAAKRAWQKARTKLRDRWYYEPEPPLRPRLKASLEGAGLTPEGADHERWKGTFRR